MSLRPAIPGFRPRSQAPLLPKLRGQFAEFPRPPCPRHALAFTARAPVSVLGTVAVTPLPSRFHGPPKSREPAKAGHSCLARVLAITALLRARTVRWGGDPTPPIRRRRDGMRAHEERTETPRRRNINRLPIRTHPFGASLGPANSWPTARRQENLALPAAGVLTRLGCYYRQDLQRRSVHGTSRPRFRPISAPAYRPPSTEGDPRSRWPT